VQILADLNRNQGVTVIMISHEELLLQQFAHEIIRLRDGQVVGREKLR
jgi:ABC-type methionine transport system ATPase subunit